MNKNFKDLHKVTKEIYNTNNNIHHGQLRHADDIYQLENKYLHEDYNKALEQAREERKLAGNNQEKIKKAEELVTHATERYSSGKAKILQEREKVFEQVQVGMKKTEEDYKSGIQNTVRDFYTYPGPFSERENC